MPAGTRSRHLVALWDVLPTLAELAGAGALLPAEIDGISLAPLLLSGGRGYGSGREHSSQRMHDLLYWEQCERAAQQARAFRPLSSLSLFCASVW